MKSDTYVTSRLSLMMFLQFFIWGGFFVTMGIYLLEVFDGETGINTIIGQAYATHNWAALLAPLFVGLLADRYFNAERVNAFCHLAGAALLWTAASVTDPGVFIWVMFAYFMLYMPTLALVNAISFANIESPERQFPAIRVWGTIGWIVAGFVVAQTVLGWVNIPVIQLITGVTNAQVTDIPLKMAAIVSVIYGLYSLTLPATPPQAKGQPFSVAKAFGPHNDAVQRRSLRRSGAARAIGRKVTNRRHQRCPCRTRPTTCGRASIETAEIFCRRHPRKEGIPHRDCFAPLNSCRQTACSRRPRFDRHRRRGHHACRKCKGRRGNQKFIHHHTVPCPDARPAVVLNESMITSAEVPDKFQRTFVVIYKRRLCARSCPSRFGRTIGQHCHFRAPPTSRGARRPRLRPWARGRTAGRPNHPSSPACNGTLGAIHAPNAWRDYGNGRGAAAGRTVSCCMCKQPLRRVT